jgi:hypothetical protein
VFRRPSPGLLDQMLTENASIGGDGQRLVAVSRRRRFRCAFY